MMARIAEVGGRRRTLVGGLLALLLALLLAVGLASPARAATDKIVFSNKYDIYTMSLDGSNTVRLTDDYMGNDVYPVWSPDGKKLAFVRDDGQVGPDFG